MGGIPTIGLCANMLDLQRYFRRQDLGRIFVIVSRVVSSFQ